MLPVVIAVAAAASAGAQWMNSESARKASKKERERINDIVNAIQDPDFDSRMLTPEDYKIAEKYVPQLAEFVSQAAPQLVKGQSAEAKLGREAQMAALDKYRNLADSGEDIQSQVMRQQALRDAAIANQGMQGALQQNMARRGLSGSNLDLVSALIAQQGASARGQEGAEQNAIAAYNRKLDAMKNSAMLGGDIRSQELDMEARNAAAINQYNQQQAAAKQGWINSNNALMNDANRYNTGLANDVSFRNTQQQNQARQAYQGMLNNQEQARYNAQINRANIASGQAARNIEGINERAQANNQAISGVNDIIGQGAQAYQASENQDYKRQQDDRMYELEKEKLRYQRGY